MGSNPTPSAPVERNGRPRTRGLPFRILGRLVTGPRQVGENVQRTLTPFPVSKGVKPHGAPFMEPHVQNSSDPRQVQVLDEEGRVIGVISRPVATEILGPGREKVYLARRPAAMRTSHAA